MVMNIILSRSHMNIKVIGQRSRPLCHQRGFSRTLFSVFDMKCLGKRPGGSSSKVTWVKVTGQGQLRVPNSKKALKHHSCNGRHVIWMFKVLKSQGHIGQGQRSHGSWSKATWVKVHLPMVHLPTVRPPSGPKKPKIT